MSFNLLATNNAFASSLTLANSLSGSSPITQVCQSTGASPQTIVWPAALPAATDYVLSVASISGSIITLQWVANGALSSSIAPPKPILNKPNPTIQK